MVNLLPRDTGLPTLVVGFGVWLLMVASLLLVLPAMAKADETAPAKDAGSQPLTPRCQYWHDLVAGFRPYHATSQYWRDLVAGEKLPPVKIITDPQPPAKLDDFRDYGFDTFGGHLKSIPFEVAATAGALAIVGLTDWHWGDSAFHVSDEGWFGEDTHNGGMDKLGHFFACYIVTDLLTQRIKANAPRPGAAELTSAAVVFSLFAGVEVLDGFTKEFGFSGEDLLADALGVAYSVTGSFFPRLREIADIRVMYTPWYAEREGVKSGRLGVLPPYRRTRYILALKPSAFEKLRETPLRYLELHLGFDARGYSVQEMELGYPKEKSFYVGVGLNLTELLFSPGRLPNLSAFRDTEPGWFFQNLFKYYQMPFT